MLTDREKVRDLGNQSAALARSIADVLNDTLDALEAAEAERDEARAWAFARSDVEEYIKRAEAAEAENARLKQKLLEVTAIARELEMQVHQYNRKVGWPRYPLKGE